MAKFLIEENARWLKNYNGTREIEALSSIPTIMELQDRKNINIVDIGCGNGRSINLLNNLFKNAHITAIDRIDENINYSMRYNQSTNVDYLVCDAVDYFSTIHDELFDLAFFSWSFFDMIKETNQEVKEKKLKLFLDDIVNNIDKCGVIIVLQPTKGGTFEKLLSSFMPSSDEIYKFTHYFLKSYGFVGPETIIPSKKDPLGIWSEFRYFNDDDLFNGIASILSLENNEILTREKYQKLIEQFRKDNSMRKDSSLILSDCVNIYYLQKGE